MANMDKPKAKEMNSYDLKVNFRLPGEILAHLNGTSSVTTALCSFDECPASKSAVAYEVKADITRFITVVYHMSNGEPSKVVVNSGRVTSLCAPLEGVLIAGTTFGSIEAFDLTDTFNHSSVIQPMNEMKFWDPTFYTDGMEEAPHFASINKLQGLIKKGST